MTNQELIDAGRKQMDETDQAIERSKMVHDILANAFALLLLLSHTRTLSP